MDTEACLVEVEEAALDFDGVFRTHYQKVARVIARVVRDHARAEELAVEVFLKLWQSPDVPSEMRDAWLYRTAVRKGLDELRSRKRRASYENLLGIVGLCTPEQISSETEERRRVQLALASIEKRQAELLVLRSDGLAYHELAAALNLNPASIGNFPQPRANGI